MTRTWAMYKRNCNNVLYDTGYRAEADGPMQIVKKAGFDGPEFVRKATRRGYGHFTGCVLVWDDISIACNRPADFVLRVV